MADADRLRQALAAAADGRLDEAASHLRGVEGDASTVDGTAVLWLYKTFIRGPRH
jgi:hypothetical protein